MSRVDNAVAYSPKKAGRQPQSMIRDLSLAASGYRKIEWARRHMPVLNLLQQEFEAHRPLEGLKIALCLHLEAKTAHLAQTLMRAGGQVFACASNPLSTQDDVVAALVDSGITVFAWHGATP